MARRGLEIGGEPRYGFGPAGPEFNTARASDLYTVESMGNGRRAPADVLRLSSVSTVIL